VTCGEWWTVNKFECVKYTQFVSKFFDVGKTFSQLLFGASLSARDMLCSSMLEISSLHVTSKILQLLLANIHLSFLKKVLQVTF